MFEWRELISSFTEYLLESSNQVRVIRDHLRVPPVCRNLCLIGPLRQDGVSSRRQKEICNIMKPKECVAVGSGQKLRRFDALDRMMDTAVHDEPVHQQK